MRSDIPTDIKKRFGECLADFAIANMTPAQLQALDQGAQGKAPVSSELVKRVLAQWDDALGEVRAGDFHVLEPYCHDDIPSFRPYVRY